MRIDLHCHTKSTKQGDGDCRNVTSEVFKEKIINSDVRILAITNHNLFDLEQFNELKESVKDFCQVWPGIEIDAQGSNGNKFHLIVVANPSNVEMFSSKIEQMYQGKNIENCLLSIEEIHHNLNECDIIYIPHLHKKPGISTDDHEKLVSLIGDSSRVFGETADNRSLGVFANHDYNVIIGSDVKDWQNYEDSTFAELKLPVDSFSQFCLLSKRDEAVVNTLLNQKQSYEVTGKPHRSVSIPLKIFNDVNIIFGQKGTGKSEILNSLYIDLLSQGLSCSKYTGSEKDDEFKALLRTTDMDRDLTKVEAEDCRNEFSILQNWIETSPTSFSSYLGWYKTKDHNKNKSKMKITEATSINETDPAQYGEHSSDFKHIKSLLKAYEKINLDLYFSNEERSELENLLSELAIRNKKMLSNDLIDIYSSKLTNYSINTIKRIADKNSNSISKPSNTGFYELAQNRIRLSQTVKNILKNIESKDQCTKDLLGELENKGKIYVQKRYRMLCNESRSPEFSVNITPLKQIKELLQKISDNIFCEELPGIIDEFNSICDEQKIDSVKPFLGLSKQIVTEDDNEYSPSNGEKGILLLQNLLREDVDAYFLDEPELGMGNSYIDSIIRPQICGLAKRHKAVIVATHNANIAVRSLPYVSIFRTHENGEYRTYTGNPFNDKLSNIEDAADVRSWTSESLHTLEGGREAFYERKVIYESNSN
ncbi:MAG: histidinol phosphatase [Clostridia bacterium]|nr:histidinol phosphatase [Clostridia bacterium]